MFSQYGKAVIHDSLSNVVVKSGYIIKYHFAL